MVTIATLDLARNQFGIVSRRQLVDLGQSRTQIAGARRRGELIEILPSTYRLASNPDTFLARAVALQLWTADVGFLSSWTAARIRGLRRMPDRPIHFTVPTGFSRRPPGWVHLDRTRWYDPDRDREILPSGLVVARPMRMLFGLAHDFNQHRFERAAEDAWHLGLASPSDAQPYLDLHRCRGKNGVRRMETWLEKAVSRPRPAQSGLEQDFIEAFDAVGLPSAVRQHPLVLPNGATIHLDIAWPEVRLAVEPGARWWHGGDAAQANDQDRSLACLEVGWSVIRLDETERFDPQAVAIRVRRAYETRRRELRTAS